MNSDLVREELERKIREKENYFYDENIPYGEWKLDSEWVNLRNELANLDNVQVVSVDKEREISLTDIKKQISNVSELIIKREEQLEENGIPYGEWQFDSEYIALLNQRQTLVNMAESKKQEYQASLDEVRFLVQKREQELIEKGFSYGEFQLDEEWVKLKNREIQLMDLLDFGYNVNNTRNNGVGNDSNKGNNTGNDAGDNTGNNTEEEEKEKTGIDFGSGNNGGNGTGNDAGDNTGDSTGNDTEEEEKDDVRDLDEDDKDENKEDNESKENDENKENEPKKVTSCKAWEWVKNHKKQILIAVGLTAVAVSTVVVLNQLIPAIIAANKASSISSLASSMINNANLWHLSSAGEQVALHGANHGLSSMITSLTGKSALFDSVAGTWTIGGSSLQAFAADAASKAAIAASKVSSLSATALGFGLGGIATTGLGAMLTNKSDKYKLYNNELKEIKVKINNEKDDEEVLVNNYPALYILINKIENDNELSNNEKKILLEKANRILNKIKLIEERLRESQEKKKEKEKRREQGEREQEKSEQQEEQHEDEEKLDEVVEEEVTPSTEENDEVREEKTETRSGRAMDKILSFFRGNPLDDATPSQDSPVEGENEEEKKDDVADLSSGDNGSNNSESVIEEAGEARTAGVLDDRFDDILNMFRDKGTIAKETIASQESVASPMDSDTLEDDKEAIADLSSGDNGSNNSEPVIEEATEARTTSVHTDPFDDILNMFRENGVIEEELGENKGRGRR